MRNTDTRKTTVIEVISFLFFTLFAMILAFFTSARAFAEPCDAALRGRCEPQRPAATSPATVPAPPRSLDF